MRAALALVLAAAFAAPLPARAAELTDVADGPADGAPMDLSLDLAYERTSRSAHVLKEYHEGLDPEGRGTDESRIIESRELTYEETTSTLDLIARAGLAKNLELSAGLPIVLSRSVKWRLPGGKAADESLILTNEYGAGTCPGRSEEFGGWRVDDGRCIPNPEALEAMGGEADIPYAPLFPVPGEAHFAGVGDPWVGVTVGILEDGPEGGNPAWIVGLRYQIPFARIADPAAKNTETEPGGVGSGFHRLTARTALSKRFGPADPYVELAYTLSLAGSRAFRNCDHPEVLGTPENCNREVETDGGSALRWPDDETDARPRHVGGLTFGSEFTPWADARAGRRFWIDVRGNAEYHSEGRDYSEASWMLRKLTYTEDFVRVGGKVRVAFDGNEHVRVGLQTGLSWESAHFLTRESIGEDFDRNGQVDLDNVGAELNPNFDFRYDVPGRRLRLDDVADWSFGAFARVAL